ncbi:hypothetical protein NUW58_g232 [Xylaria curta]|uniref:Uncharacterized protein n=1 Tax=Xylaria curta TaxID=42375 RepID=A0ACC1PQ38_9PEZI|nr:hypothetical protein NUW58_g232 [Xylaria curta]
MSIQPLPDSVIAQIKSSATITTLNGVVCGLFRNSLDSGASRVTISIDYVRGNCSVEDDGLGILPAEFQSSGGLGKLHFTSKYPAHEGTHGKHGAFLASLASLSLLSITSHHHKYHSHNSIQMYNSDILARHTPSLPNQRLLSYPHGTRVTVRDLFGSMPVRAKQRVIDAERGMHSKYWEILKRHMVALLLAWERPVSISVRESASGWTLSVRRNQIQQEGDGFGPGPTAKTSNILYQAQLSDENKPETWVPLRASAGGLSVTGAVSLYPVATRRIQFISMGIHPVPNDHGSNILYEEINRIFSNSSYGAEEDTEALKIDGSDKTKNGQITRKDRFIGQELKGRKSVDRWPMFYMRIYFGDSTNAIAPNEIDELLDERHGSLTAIVDMLRAVAYEFLKKYRFRPKRIRTSGDDIPSRSSRSSPPKRSVTTNHTLGSISATGVHKKRLLGDLATTQLSIPGYRSSHLRPESPFDLWSRVKSGSPQHMLSEKKADEKFTSDKYQTVSSEMVTPDPDKNNLDSEPPLFGLDGSLLRAPFVTENSIPHGDVEEFQCARLEKRPRNEDIRWTNPIMKKTSIIDPRTGFIIPSPDRKLEEGTGKSDSIRCRRRHSDSRSASNAEQSVWLRELLSSWENPVFKITEPCIPSAFTEENGLGRPIQPFGRGSRPQYPPEVGVPTQGRVSKTALSRAEIIAQVDRKFIFAKVLVDSFPEGPTSPQSAISLLIIIDQHAADERCRVESLMKGYFETVVDTNMSDLATSEAAPISTTYTARTELLERPLKFDISIKDTTQLERTVTHFAHWGIHYNVLQSKKTGHGQVEVTRLPPSIAERCRLEPRLLIELLRKEAWNIDGHSYHSTPVEDPDSRNGEIDALHWITKFHGCPEGVLDMINSRACRSSIMFNDPLSQEECVGLLKRLADCAFPFQCAHGRPSMVPLVDLGDKMAKSYNERRPTDSFRNAFKAWNAADHSEGHSTTTDPIQSILNPTDLVYEDGEPKCPFLGTVSIAIPELARVNEAESEQLNSNAQLMMDLNQKLQISVRTCFIRLAQGASKGWTPEFFALVLSTFSFIGLIILLARENNHSLTA